MTFLVYDDFGARHANLVERIKVDLPRLRVDYFRLRGHRRAAALDGDPAEYFQRP